MPSGANADGVSIGQRTIGRLLALVEQRPQCRSTQRRPRSDQSQPATRVARNREKQCGAEPQSRNQNKTMACQGSVQEHDAAANRERDGHGREVASTDRPARRDVDANLLVIRGIESPQIDRDPPAESLTTRDSHTKIEVTIVNSRWPRRLRIPRSAGPGQRRLVVLGQRVLPAIPRASSREPSEAPERGRRRPSHQPRTSERGARRLPRRSSWRLPSRACGRRRGRGGTIAFRQSDRTGGGPCVIGASPMQWRAVRRRPWSKQSRC
jgi:hypothetical protein